MTKRGIPSSARWPSMARVNAYLDADALRLAALGGRWQRLDVVASTGSTNADLAEAARQGAAPGRVLVSAHQSAGRGRFARRWEAPPDTSIAVSVLVAPARPVDEWGWLPLLTGLGVAEGLAASTGLDAVLKWPNDVLVNDRKICGILCEAVAVGEGTLAVAGMGVNIALTREQLPVASATSVRLEGSDADATAVAAAVLAALEEWLGRWEAGEDVAASYRERCATIGRDVEVHTPDGIVRGLAVGADDAGALLVEVDGGVRAFVAGDVVHVRR